MKENKERELDNKMKHLEDTKNDNIRHFYVMRYIQKHNRNTKSPIMIKVKEGNVPGTKEGKIKVIEEYFRQHSCFGRRFSGGAYLINSAFN